uniref:THUMP domain-containing protein 2 n=1 Tax=Callorhinchus milii TaxID=7868 RepID=V9KIP5_CALMI
MSGVMVPPGNRYFCTASRGTERFLAEEVCLKLSASNVEQISGKVFFTSEADLKKLKSLKCAERLFLLVKKLPPLQIPGYRGKGIYVLQKCVIGEPSQWLNSVSTWENLQDFHKPEEQTLGVTENGLKRPSQEESNETKTKREKLDSDLDEAAVTAPDKSPTGQSDLLSKTQGNRQERVTASQSTLPPDEPCKPTNESDTTRMSFRVSCRCSGKMAKRFTAQELGRAIGVALAKEMGWKAELRNPTLEVFIHLSDIHCVVGIPIVRLPLASRDYIKTVGLRSTVAWAMAYLADIKTGSFVLDPMCGMGTILVEAAKEWPNAYYQGIDNNTSQLKIASTNVCFAKLAGNIDLMRASVTELPLLSESVDVVICDVPFGKKFKISQDSKTAMPHIIREMVRVLRVGGTLLLLLSQELSLEMQRWFKSRNQKCDQTELSAAKDTDRLSTKLCSDPVKDFDIVVEDISLPGITGENEKCEMKIKAIAPLVSNGIFQVSLGVTEAAIHRYKKCSVT